MQCHAILHITLSSYIAGVSGLWWKWLSGIAMRVRNIVYAYTDVTGIYYFRVSAVTLSKYLNISRWRALIYDDMVYVYIHTLTTIIYIIQEVCSLSPIYQLCIITTSHVMSRFAMVESAHVIAIHNPLNPNIIIWFRYPSWLLMRNCTAI